MQGERMSASPVSRSKWPAAKFELSDFSRRLKSAIVAETRLQCDLHYFIKMFGRSIFDLFDPYGFDDAILFGRSGTTFANGDIDRRSFAPVSERALRALDDVGSIFITAHFNACIDCL